MVKRHLFKSEVVARSSAVTKEPKATLYKRCENQASLTGGRDVIIADSRRFCRVVRVLPVSGLSRFPDCLESLNNL